MILYQNYKQIDKKKWNNCIRNSINGMVYAYEWYLNAVCENWGALIENDYETVMPFAIRRKMGIFYVYPPIFTQQMGIFSTKSIDIQTCERFINILSQHFYFIEYHLNTHNYLDNKTFKLKDNSNYLLFLTTDYNDIYKNYSENLKRNLKKAEKSKVFISKETKVEDIITIFSENKGKELNKFSKNDYESLKNLIDSCMLNHTVEIWGAYTPQQALCAGAIFIIGNQRAIFLFSATDKTAKELYAMPFLINCFIKENTSKNIILDFEGSNDKNLARFYKSFGSKETKYQTLTINKLPFYINLGIKLTKFIRKNAFNKKKIH